MITDEFFSTRDMWSCITLCAMGHVPADISVLDNDNEESQSLSLQYRFLSAAKTDFDKFNRGEAIMVDIQDVINAQRIFKSNVHRLLGSRR